MSPRKKFTSVTAICTAVFSLLRRAREHQEITIKELAARSGISPAVLSRLELGRRIPNLDDVILESMLLGVRFSDVMRKAEDEVFPLPPRPWTHEPPGALLERLTNAEWEAVARAMSFTDPAYFGDLAGEAPDDTGPPGRLVMFQRPDDGVTTDDCPHADLAISVELRRDAPTDVLRCTECGEEITPENTNT